ncbi:carboxypeptidase-like regulatory domain-containing protein [Aureitalea marina]|uniref:Alpha-2-macroglobulin domain-containing protein n=1 Tax=Aureitalea marina TaxID=930804 RepID=A0A2S7KTE0_9FLAO|nr:carboxypeptidase-like regulatory domain-containing protein [Aureitalea marina]PQB05866.1 hypothetical protein BST85_13885 [Aureitalea marina]
MKPLLILALFLSTLTLTAQTEQRFDKLWTEVESLELAGKVRSASKKVEKILAKARRSENGPQMVKAFLYHSKFLLVLDQDPRPYILTQLEVEIDKGDLSTKAVLHSVYAELLEQYLNKYRHKIRNRTPVAGAAAQGNIESWGLDQFYRQIDRHYRMSVQAETALQQADIQQYQLILSGSKVSSKYRPTLFDFLSHRAIAYYKKGKWDGQRPKERFRMNDPVVFQPTDVFLKAEFKTPDSLLSNRNVLKFYQGLEKFHQSRDTSAYLDVVLKRMQFASRRSQVENSGDLYKQALEKLANNYRSHEASAMIQFQLASFLYEQSKSYAASLRPGFELYRIKAVELCDLATSSYPNSDGGTSCAFLRKTITAPQLELTAEQYVIPDKPFLVKVESQGVDSLFLAAYKVSQGSLKGLNRYHRDSLVDHLIKTQQPLRLRKYALKQMKDYYSHTTEVDFSPLPAGNYVLTAAVRSVEDSVAHIFSYDQVGVSRLVMLSKDLNDGIMFRVVDRETGLPVEKAHISLVNPDYFGSGQTDKTGSFHLKKDDKYHRNLNLLIHKDGDTLSDQNFSLNRRYLEDEEEDRVAKAFLYLDRSIYRPGQTLYFKGILVEKQKGDYHSVDGVYVNVTIYDSNMEEIKEFRLKTNEYGSIHGQYSIPLSLLPGEFSIEMDQDWGNDEEEDDPYWEDIDDFNYRELSFSVEEYKRPRFEVSIDPYKDAVGLNDSILLSGSAKDLIGSAVADARMKYEISREQAYSYYGGYRGSDAQIISTGQGTTDKDGIFQVPLVTEVDRSVTSWQDAKWIYTLKVDITDLSGETRSANYSIYAGTRQLKLELNAPTRVNGADRAQIKVNSINLNDHPWSSDLKLDIYKLASPERALRKKPWEVVEIPHLSKEEFVRLFPHEPYDSTDARQNWANGQQVLSRSVRAKGETALWMGDMSDWEPGAYQIEVLGVDKKGDTVHQTEQFELYFPELIALSDNQAFQYQLINSDFSKDQEIRLRLKTNFDNLSVKLEAHYQNNPIFSELVQITDGYTDLGIPLKAYYAGQITVNLQYVRHNDIYTQRFDVNLPQANSELRVETTSFRDRLLPDQKETWSFKITGPDGEPSNAEILVSMYDSSLDQFIEHAWNTELQFENFSYYYGPMVESGEMFRTTDFVGVRKFDYNHFYRQLQNYHQLKWFGLDFGSIEGKNRQYLFDLRSRLENPNVERGNISGFILDRSGLPLPGVNVVVKGTNIGTQTDFDGYYTLDAPPGAQLQFSYVGFESIEAKIDGLGTYNLTMDEDLANLDEVVVTAQGIRKEAKALGYSVSTVVNAEMSEEEVLFALSGKAAGVQITNQVAYDMAGTNIVIRGYSSIGQNNDVLFIVDGVPLSKSERLEIDPTEILDFTALKGDTAVALYGTSAKNGVVLITTKSGLKELASVETRDNLKETAFFYPQLLTDSKGEIAFDFDAPQALTKWKFMLLAHTKDIQVGRLEKVAVTQKDISLIPNFPRFFRSGDTVVVKAKINNFSNEKLGGSAILQLKDGLKSVELDPQRIQLDQLKPFSIDKGANVVVEWQFKVPENLAAMEYKIVAKTKEHSDGESGMIPVITNRVLITETRPVWLTAGGKKEYQMEKLVRSESTSQENFALEVEYTENPTWLALKSLPYLIEFPYECAEQTFARYYANALGESIVTSNPEIAQVMEAWKIDDVLNSPLEKNQDLKTALLSASPWATNELTEGQQKQNISRLLDVEQVRQGQLETLAKLKQMQSSSGAFPWFSGGPDNPYITRHIVAGLGQLKFMKVGERNTHLLKAIRINAVNYLDRNFAADYQKRLLAQRDSTKVRPTVSDVHYLYTRSFHLSQHPFQESVKRVVDDFLQKGKQDWLGLSLYEQGLLALVYHRIGDTNMASTIVDALEERVVKSEENGWYWKENRAGWRWFNSQIETQSLLIEVFAEVDQDVKKIEALKQWLVRNKRARSWGTTKATTEAIYAMLHFGESGLEKRSRTRLEVGNQTILAHQLPETEKEAKTGYFKLRWSAQEIEPEMGNITIENRGETSGMGGVYWQYYEDSDRVSASANPALSINRQLYKRRVGPMGEELIPLGQEDSVSLGDLIVSRIEITVAEDMDFLHLKDDRASGLEPVDVLSSYQWNDGVGYYQVTRDQATHFFFDHLYKGTYVFDYQMRANLEGHFSNSVSTLQSLYAPEFSANSEGILVQIID